MNYDLFTDLIASNLHKNSKVCKMITSARDFFIRFFDQGASCARPRPVPFRSAIIKKQKNNNYNK